MWIRTLPMAVWVFHWNQHPSWPNTVRWRSCGNLHSWPLYLRLPSSAITPSRLLHWESHKCSGSQAMKQKVHKATCNACDTCSLRSEFGKYNCGSICMARPPLVDAYWYLLYSMKLAVYLAKPESLEF